jgi:3'-phosphoadenosine 5'-phosphosulfate sulfotransferase (PAPS reductase)/FAD synthetase
MTALLFSGGKDSTALMYLCRGLFKEQDIKVYVANTGAMFPHMEVHIALVCKELEVEPVYIKPPMPIEDYIALHGMPADIVPTDALPEYNWIIAKPDPLKLQPYFRCCTEMIFKPMQAQLRRDGHDIVMRGTKKSDTRIGVPNGYTEAGIRYEFPIWDWSDEDVFHFLREEGCLIPEHYLKASNIDSLDCWLCTGHMAYHGKEKLQYMKEAYPDLHAILKQRLALVGNAVDRYRRKLSSVYKET